MQRSKWVVTPAALGVRAGGVKPDWRTIIRHTSPEIRAMFEQLEAYHRAAQAEGGPKASAKRYGARQAAAAKQVR